MSGKHVDFTRESKKNFVSKKINQSLAKLKNNKPKEIGNESTNNRNRIDNYFAQSKSVSAIPNENQNDEISDLVSNHMDIVENQSQVNAGSEQPVDELSNVNEKRLQKEIEVLTKNLNAAKSLLRKTNQVNMEKDLQIKKLAAESEAKKKSDHLFDEFSSDFDKNELTAIKSVGPGQKNDSRFVLNIMRFLYKNDEEAKLKNRSACGRKFKNEKKLEISFEKKSILKRMYKQRVDDELPELAHSATANEHSKRMKNFNSLVRSAIHNILKAVQKEECKKRARDDEFDEFPSSKHSRTNEGIKLNLGY